MSGLILPLLLLSCRITADSMTRPKNVKEAAEYDVSPPPAATEQHSKLYQVLYVGEFGPDAYPQGQRARMLAWLGAVHLRTDQLQHLLLLYERVLVWRAAADAREAEMGRREAEKLAPLYDELSKGLASPEPLTEDQLADLAARMQRARGEITADGDPRQASFDDLHDLLDEVKAWLMNSNRAERAELAKCRFFLQRRMGPLLNPGDYTKYTGIAWDGGDFSALSRTGRSDSEKQMDIGGLWSTEPYRAAPGAHLEDLEVAAIMVMALQEPGIAEAIEVQLKKRDPLDYSPYVPGNVGEIRELPPPTSPPPGGDGMPPPR